VRRREALTLFLCAPAWPRLALGQDRVRRVALMMLNNENDLEGQNRIVAFRAALAKLGWNDGANVRLEVKWLGGDPARTRDYASELVAEAPDVIVANGTAAAAALPGARKTTPVAFVVVTDPLGAGFVQSLSRPGGNITGFSTFEPDMGTKWLELLKAVAPTLSCVGLLTQPGFKGFAQLIDTIEQHTARFGMQALSMPIQGSADLDDLVPRLAREGGTGLIILPTPLNAALRQRIISLAATHRLPAIYPFSYYSRDGGLMAYGVDAGDIFERAAPYVARILQGESPGDLPVEAPTKFQLIVNLKTAKQLNIVVPPALLARVDEVIE
jgi:putative tryptophan/tyrosine transport system substrate-binding protein